MIQMKALKTFSGAEGFYLRGNYFFVDSMDRAEQLQTRGIAKIINRNEQPTEPIDEPVTNPIDEPIENPTEPDEDDAINEENPIEEKPPDDDRGWQGEIEQPIPIDINQMAQKQEQLEQKLSDLENQLLNFQNRVETQIQFAPNENNRINYRYVGQPHVQNNHDPNYRPPNPMNDDFAQVVNYLGNGYYQLPSGKVVFGEAQARNIYREYSNGGI